jgi:hypothetical protein
MCSHVVIFTKYDYGVLGEAYSAHVSTKKCIQGVDLKI